MNFATADGAVHFVSDDIDTIVYNGLGSRNGQEAVEIP